MNINQGHKDWNKAGKLQINGKVTRRITSEKVEKYKNT